MRRLIFLFGLMTMVMTGAVAAPLKDEATGLSFPGSPGPWLRVGFREFEPKAQYGVSYTYQREGREQGVLTCYVFNLGFTDIPDGADSDRVRQEMLNTFNGVTQLWNQQGATVSEIMPIGALRTQAGNVLFAYVGAHHIQHQGTANISISLVSAYRGHFLKLRYTFPGNDLQAAVDDATEFVDLLFKANGHVLPALTVVKEPLRIAGVRNVAISFIDRRLPSTPVGTLWIAYATMRLKYRGDHGLALPESGDIRPTFAEEVFARSEAVKIYDEVVATDPTAADAYWDALAKVAANGFMPAYVWTHHKRFDWPESEQPQDLAKFVKWQKKNLKKHVPDTAVVLQMQDP